MDGFAFVMSSYSGNKAQLTRTYVDEGGREKSIIRRILRLLKRVPASFNVVTTTSISINPIVEPTWRANNFFLGIFLYANYVFHVSNRDSVPFSDYAIRPTIPSAGISL